MAASRAWQLRDLTVADGRRLRARCWPGRGRPLVLLHGLFDDAEGWDALARDTRRPCFAVDLPGFGASEGPTRPRLRAYAEDVVEALDALDVRECTLVGPGRSTWPSSRWRSRSSTRSRSSPRTRRSSPRLPAVA